MNNVIMSLLDEYKCLSAADYKNALKEVMQEIALLGLSRARFFDKAAFYGGTALRIAHKTLRFSEDLDFSLLKENHKFNLDNFLRPLEEEFRSFGINADIRKKEKNMESPVESAFIKSNTLEHLIQIPGLPKPVGGVNKNDVIKIKIEIDINPPTVNGSTETLFLMRPFPFSVRIFTLGSLFAGKLHAVLCRSWKSGRAKGRDFYDLIWFIRKKTGLNTAFLEAKMKQTGHLSNSDTLDTAKLKELLKLRIREIDIEETKNDVKNLVSDPFELNVWSVEFFDKIIDDIQ